MKEEGRTVYVQHFQEDGIDLPDTCEEFLAFWVEKFKGIPKDCLSEASIDLETEDYYGCTNFNLDIYYHRPENSQEIKDREARESAKEGVAARHKEFIIKEELRQLERLTRKYPGHIQ